MKARFRVSRRNLLQEREVFSRAYSPENCQRFTPHQLVVDGDHDSLFDGFGCGSRQSVNIALLVNSSEDCESAPSAAKELAVCQVKRRCHYASAPYVRK